MRIGAVQWVLPEVAAQAVLTVLLLVTGQLLVFVLYLPLLACYFFGIGQVACAF